MSQHVRIQDHPEYPFTNKREHLQAAKWQQSFLFREGLLEPESELLASFLRWTLRYAFLEQIVQGEIRYELPLHKAVTIREGMPVAAEEGERLARSELELMDDPDVPALEILDRLEDQGVKVITSMTSPILADGEGERLAGFFFFDGQTGPAFGSLAPRDDPRSPFVLAHLLGHLVMDVNPYRNRVCAWDHRLDLLEKDPVEERADRFARALLLPEPRVRTVLDQIASAVHSGETPVARMHELLYSIFAIPPALLDRRLEDLGLNVLRQQLRQAAKGNGAANGEAHGLPPMPSLVPPSAIERFELPERYVNLALACCAEKVMDARELARFLDLDLESAQLLLEKAGIDPDAEDD